MITAEQFAKDVQSYLVDVGVAQATAVIETPPGRRPNPELVALSAWYRGLASTDRNRVKQVMKFVAKDTGYRFCAFLHH